MKRFFSLFIGISFFIFLVSVLLLNSKHATASVDHIVISEIQTEGFLTTDDFIELYNPTSMDINLGSYRLVRRTANATTDTNLISFTNSDIIPSYGYFLWCNSNLSTTLSCDKNTGGSITNNNSVALRNGDLDTGTIIDSVTFGTVANTLGEGATLTNPTASTSVERKANNLSSSFTMSIGGIDEFLGNSQDTNNNSIDFVFRSIPQPQNKFSFIELAIIPSPTPTLSPISTTNPTPSLTTTPSLQPTNTPSPTPTIEPTISPTPIPTNSPTPIPTATPTLTPSPTPIVSVISTPTPIPSIEPTVFPSITPFLTITPTLSPTISPKPTPTGRVLTNGPIFTCSLSYKSLNLFRKTIYIPSILCTRTSN